MLLLYCTSSDVFKLLFHLTIFKFAMWGASNTPPFSISDLSEHPIVLVHLSVCLLQCINSQSPISATWSHLMHQLNHLDCNTKFYALVGSMAVLLMSRDHLGWPMDHILCLPLCDWHQRKNHQTWRNSCIVQRNVKKNDLLYPLSTLTESGCGVPLSLDCVLFIIAQNWIVVHARLLIWLTKPYCET